MKHTIHTQKVHAYNGALSQQPEERERENEQKKRNEKQRKGASHRNNETKLLNTSQSNSIHVKWYG